MNHEFNIWQLKSTKDNFSKCQSTTSQFNNTFFKKINFSNGSETYHECQLWKNTHVSRYCRNRLRHSRRFQVSFIWNQLRYTIIYQVRLTRFEVNIPEVLSETECVPLFYANAFVVIINTVLFVRLSQCVTQHSIAVR